MLGLLCIERGSDRTQKQRVYLDAGNDRTHTQKICAAIQKVFADVGSDRTLTQKVHSYEPLVLPLQPMVSKGKQRVQRVKPMMRSHVWSDRINNREYAISATQAFPRCALHLGRR